MKKVYLAARYSRHGEMQRVRADLEFAGYEVTSRWIDGGHEMSKEGSTEADRAERARFAMEDLADLMAAEICISFTEEPRTTTTRGGRHVEFGIAYARRMPCMVVGPIENVFHCLPYVEVYPTWADAQAALPVYTRTALEPPPAVGVGEDLKIGATYSMADGRAKLPDIVREANETRTAVMLERYGKPVAAIVPAKDIATMFSRAAEATWREDFDAALTAPPPNPSRDKLREGIAQIIRETPQTVAYDAVLSDAIMRLIPAHLEAQAVSELVEVAKAYGLASIKYAAAQSNEEQRIGAWSCLNASEAMKKAAIRLAAVGEQGPQPGPEPESLVWHSVDQPVPAHGYILVGPTSAEGVPEVWAAETYHLAKARPDPAPGWAHLTEAADLIRYWAHIPAFPTNVSRLAAVGSPNPGERERTISAMAAVLEATQGFHPELTGGERFIKASVTATALYSVRGDSPNPGGGE